MFAKEPPRVAQIAPSTVAARAPLPTAILLTAALVAQPVRSQSVASMARVPACRVGLLAEVSVLISTQMPNTAELVDKPAKEDKSAKVANVSKAAAPRTKTVWVLVLIHKTTKSTAEVAGLSVKVEQRVKKAYVNVPRVPDFAMENVWTCKSITSTAALAATSVKKEANATTGSV